MVDEARPLVIWHAGCRDGFCAAWAARRALPPNTEFYEGYYGQPPPDVRGRAVYVVDFSYPRADMERIADEAASLTVFDHHKTAEEALRGFGQDRPWKVRVVFDMSRSGAGITWDSLHPGESRPWLVDYVEDRDLWRFVKPRSREINAYLSTLPFDFEVWDKHFETFDGLVDRGEAVLAKTAQYCAEVAKNARRVRFQGLNVPMVNAPQVDVSELHDLLLSDEKGPNRPAFSLAWWQRADGRFQYSLRSRDDFDVSRVAQQYGGGGHHNAAGFELSTMLALEDAGAK